MIITPDDNVDVPKGKPRGKGRPIKQEQRDVLAKFLAMKPGQSFFVEDGQSRDLEFLRRLAKLAGVNIKRVEVARDEIYGTAGVRCWRLAGPYDSKPTPTNQPEDDEL